MAPALAGRSATVRPGASAEAGPTDPDALRASVATPPPTGLARAIRRKPTRSLSGVAIVAVMTSPAHCPHGRCTYCPGGLEQRAPQSYTGEEPSALRGAQFRYDAEAIVRHRLATLDEIGHATSKVEVIVMGGTFPARARTYQRTVLQGIYNGLNGTPSASLEEARERNPSATHRLVGLTVETRPDWCDERVLPFLLDAGVTRVELGVECLDDTVLERVHRAHGTDEVARATRDVRARGLKVGYHLMLGLPGMDPDADLAGFRRIWAEDRFRPDFLKIYPTLVLPGTPLYDDWTAGRYAPYETATAVGVLAAIKREVPPWVRIHRIQRDIPARLIAAGVRTSNLRQLAQRRLAEEGARCRCLRCREPGRTESPPAEEFELRRTDYSAAGGRELFLAFEHDRSGLCAAYLRLRLPPDGPTEVGLREPVVRELKVVGRELGVGEAPVGPATYQHRGFGSRLLGEAEAIAGSAGYRRLVVTSAVGTRPYYERRGYRPEGPYVVRSLSADGGS